MVPVCTQGGFDGVANALETDVICKSLEVGVGTRLDRLGDGPPSVLGREVVDRTVDRIGSNHSKRSPRLLEQSRRAATRAIVADASICADEASALIGTANVECSSTPIHIGVVSIPTPAQIGKEFSTEGSIEWWRDVFHDACAPGGRRNTRQLPSGQRLEQRVLGAVAISDIECQAMQVGNRGGSQIGRLGGEDFLVSTLTRGSARLEQGGRLALQGPGDIVIYDAAQQFSYFIAESSHILLARVPRRLMLGRLQNAERLTAITIGGATPLGNLAASMVRSVASLDLAGNGAASARVGASLVNILSAAIEIEISTYQSVSDRQVALRKRAKAYMRARIDDPDLDVNAIAQAVHVSSRTLGRAFALEGTTAMRWLWKERLEACRAALTDGRIKQVSDGALAYGFVSPSHFSRMFRLTYGIQPQSLLRAAARVG